MIRFFHGEGVNELQLKDVALMFCSLVTLSQVALTFLSNSFPVIYYAGYYTNITHRQREVFCKSRGPIQGNVPSILTSYPPQDLVHSSFNVYMQEKTQNASMS